METEKPQIKGYRELSFQEIELINIIKQKGVELGDLVDSMRDADKYDAICDGRWVSIAATDLQRGLMALTRAVAKPETF